MEGRSSRRDQGQPDSHERIVIQCIHWAVVLVVVVSVTILAFRGDLDKASATAIFGTVVGHAGTSASQKLQARARHDD